MNIAGCWVRDGRITRGAQARLQRGGRTIIESRVSSLRHFREDVREMTAGFECGIVLEGFNDYREGDVIETSVERVGSRPAALARKEWLRCRRTERINALLREQLSELVSAA
jgi:translation initiation factor IF-2